VYVRELLNLTLEAHLFALQLRLFATVDTQREAREPPRSCSLVLLLALLLAARGTHLSSLIALLTVRLFCRSCSSRLMRFPISARRTARPLDRPRARARARLRSARPRRRAAAPAIRRRRRRTLRCGIARYVSSWQAAAKATAALRARPDRRDEKDQLAPVPRDQGCAAQPTGTALLSRACALRLRCNGCFVSGQRAARVAPPAWRLCVETGFLVRLALEEQASENRAHSAGRPVSRRSSARRGRRGEHVRPAGVSLAAVPEDDGAPETGPPVAS
jgi:hypothetical protein